MRRLLAHLLEQRLNLVDDALKHLAALHPGHLAALHPGLGLGFDQLLDRAGVVRIVLEQGGGAQVEALTTAGRQTRGRGAQAGRRRPMTYDRDMTDGA